MLNRRNVLLQLLFMSSLISIIPFIIGCQRNSSKNNINGDFEIKSPTENEPAGWFTTSGRSSWITKDVSKTNKFVVFTWDSAEHHSGSHSVSISVDPSHPEDLFANSWIRTFDEFTIGKKYSISGWIKTVDIWMPVGIIVLGRNKDHKITTFAYAGDPTHKFYPLKGTTDWRLLRTNYKVKEGTVEVRIIAGINTPGKFGGKVWFDDIKIE